MAGSSELSRWGYSAGYGLVEEIGEFLRGDALVGLLRDGELGLLRLRRRLAALYLAELGPGRFGLLPGDPVDPLQGHGDEPAIVAGLVLALPDQVVEACVEAWRWGDGEELGDERVWGRVGGAAGVEEAAAVVVDSDLGEVAVQVPAGEDYEVGIEVREFRL